ncbi:NUDIX domain-containing protein [Tardiphaga sp.]|jgi:nudix-type nucleoside diphosphatase (YffH/AdpP family)|uniref:NUDIX domain-containing protein n=1 Tax=Tardiphaga sp. TaxID=1926292 RepID=UPI0037D9FF75
MGTIIETTTLFKGWLTLLRAKIAASAGHEFHRLIEDHGGAVAVLPYDALRQTVIVISQFRAPVAFGSPDEPDVLEPIAGGIDNDDPDIAVRREALEEAGVGLQHLEPIGVYWCMPALSTERIHLYLAPYSAMNRVADGGGLADEDENIRVHEISFAKLFELTSASGCDLKLLALSQALKRRLEILETKSGADRSPS